MAYTFTRKTAEALESKATGYARTLCAQANGTGIAAIHNSALNAQAALHYDVASAATAVIDNLDGFDGFETAHDDLSAAIEEAGAWHYSDMLYRLAAEMRKAA
jgi:hypothetical protein